MRDVLLKGRDGREGMNRCWRAERTEGAERAQRTEEVEVAEGEEKELHATRALAEPEAREKAERRNIGGGCEGPWNRAGG